MFKNKNIICLTGFAFILVLIPSALKAQSQLTLLEATIKQLQPFTCRFAQVYHDAFQEKTTTATGTFSFKQPGLMKWVYEQPEEILFMVGRDKAWLYDPDLENVTIQSLENVSGIQSLRFLSGSENISDHFHIVKPEKVLLDTTSDKSVIFLAPLKQNQALAELQIIFDGRTKRIHQFVLVDHNRNYRKITLSDIHLDSSLKDSDFEFTVTEEMEVIEGVEK